MANTSNVRQDASWKMWRLCIVDDESNRTVVNLVQGGYSIGRAEDNGIRLTERNVSRKHARLESRDSGWVLLDVGSYTGCFVNDIRVEAEKGLSHQDRIRIGDYELVLSDLEREAADDKHPRQDAETLPGSPVAQEILDQDDRIAIVEGLGAGALFPLRSSVTLIGRGEECDIALNDTSVSRQHCAIERDEHGRYQVVDKNSSNGVRVNGTTVKRMALYSRDFIELGDVILQFVPQGARFELQAARHSRSRRPERRRPFRWGVLTLATLVCAIAAGIGLRRFMVESSLLAAHNGDVNRTEQRLAQARDLLLAHRSDAAHHVLSEIPSSDPARSSDEFRQMEATWADDLFELVERTSDVALQRTLLHRVLQNPGMDSERTDRAQARLEQLSEGALAELPIARNAQPAAADDNSGARQLPLNASRNDSPVRRIAAVAPQTPGANAGTPGSRGNVNLGVSPGSTPAVIVPHGAAQPNGVPQPNIASLPSVAMPTPAAAPATGPLANAATPSNALTPVTLTPSTATAAAQSGLAQRVYPSAAQTSPNGATRPALSAPVVTANAKAPAAGATQQAPNPGNAITGGNNGRTVAPPPAPNAESKPAPGGTPAPQATQAAPAPPRTTESRPSLSTARP